MFWEGENTKVLFKGLEMGMFLFEAEIEVVEYCKLSDLKSCEHR